MKTQILFIQGAGKGAYKEDEKLVVNLRQALGKEYEVRYPAMPNEENAPYEQWKQQIEKELDAMAEPMILVGHSVGGSALAKVLTEIDAKKSIIGIFLIAAPFWGSDGWTYEGYEKLELPKTVHTKFPRGTHVFLYHSRDDETVPFAHLALYAKRIPQATTRVTRGGHQLKKDLSLVAKDIKNI
jgi:predicted alpha/beta hydrolase family esterase